MKLSRRFGHTTSSTTCNFVHRTSSTTVVKAKNYPSMRPAVRGEHTVDIPEDQYGVPNVMLHGLQPGRKLERAVHPLEYSEKHWDENKRTMDFSMLRNTQGLHAPLKLQMEIHTAKHFGRLPCLASSNTMLDSLTGRDDLINFDDIFNSPYESEMVGDAHLLLEKRQGML
ncbi:proteasome maturation protein [Mytilus galloprovincialis]|uniref:Proteasome maturation protein n=2 Tax=Mytilus galloprovincialis TaxID=29158 RepID=A0A8B6ELM9_MYTGA|nr:proteasome maturation protein [Mytilus galloprovincialis]